MLVFGSLWVVLGFVDLLDYVGFISFVGLLGLCGASGFCGFVGSVGLCWFYLVCGVCRVGGVLLGWQGFIGFWFCWVLGFCGCMLGYVC